MQEKIKELLLAEKARIEAELRGFAGEDPEVEGNFVAKFPEYGDHEDENVNEVADYGDRLSLDEELKSSLAKVVRALERIEEGSYGICEICGQPIPEQRLLAQPMATTDVVCEEKKGF